MCQRHGENCDKNLRHRYPKRALNLLELRCPPDSGMRLAKWQ